MIMAAGLGTRLRPFTEKVPKPLLPVMGVPIAQFAADLLLDSGLRRVVANVHHLADMAREGLLALDWGGANLQISDETGRLLGSAGGIRKALSKLGDGPFFLLNSDVLCELDLRALALRHQQQRERWGVTMTLAVFGKGPPGGLYREIKVDFDKGLIRGLGEHSEGRPFYAGFAVVEPEALSSLPQDKPSDFVEQVLKPAISSGKAAAYLSSGSWHDVGSARHWLEVHLSLIKMLESEAINERWRARIEGSSEKLSAGIWVSKGAAQADGLEGARWEAPCYWSSTEPENPLPARLGPRAVLYGVTPPDVAGESGLREGIGFGGSWVSI